MARKGKKKKKEGKKRKFCGLRSASNGARRPESNREKGLMKGKGVFLDELLMSEKESHLSLFFHHFCFS